MNVLVTGDRGYIGSVLVSLLLQNGYQVTGLDTEFFSSMGGSAFGGKTEVSFSKDSYKKITKDIRNVDEKDLENVEAIIHLSALSNDPMGEIDPALTEEINYKASIRLAKIAKEAGIKRFLFSSSCSIYGIAKKGIVDESSDVNPLTAYAKSKIETEKELRKIADDRFCIGILRNSTVYGYSPKFRNDLVVNNLVTTALVFGEIRILSDGTPWRPLIDVRDLSRIFIEFLKVDSKKINGKIINIGFDENNLQVKDIVSIVRKYVPNCKVIYTGEHGKDTRSYKVNFDKFKLLFPQAKQKWPLEKSVADLIMQLKAINYSKEDFVSGKYTRMVVLKNLIDSKKVDSMLYFK